MPPPQLPGSLQSLVVPEPLQTKGTFVPVTLIVTVLVAAWSG